MDVTELVELLSRFGFSGLLADGVDSNRLASVTAMACASLGIPERFVADEAFATALREAVRRDDETPPGPGFVVRGYVRNELGAPIVGATVDVFDQDLRTRQLLGRTRTDERGHYVVPYTRESFSRREKRAADVVVSVSPRPPAPGFASELLWNAPAVAVVHLTSGQMQPRDAFAILSSQIAPLLEAIPNEGRPALKPEQLDETDVPFLVRETERAADELSRFLQAHRFALELGCHPSFVFGCLMHGVNGPYRDYVRTPASAHRAALERSFVANTVRRFPREEVERYIALLQRAAARDVIDEQTPDNVLAPFWRSVLSSPGALEAFTSVVADSDRSLEDTWATLRAHPALGSSLFGIEQVAKLADATGGHAPLLRAVNERLILGQPGRPGDTPWSRFVALSRADLARLIDQVGAPKGVPGSDEAKQRAIYVEAIDRSLDEVALPERLASRIVSHSDPNVREVAVFLVAHPRFDLRSRATDEALARMSTGARQKLRVYQRLARLVPRADMIVKLAENGFLTARHVARLPLDDLRVHIDFPDELGDLDTLKGTHRNANAFTTMESVITLEKPIWNEQTGSVGALKPSKPITLANLFGSMDHCACEECSSVDGPAAYLVDLWNVLSDNAKLALEKSRPDIKSLPLSCANTLTPMPAIDLVLEVLEEAVLPGGIDRDQVHTEGELRAWPQNLRTQAYESLALQTFPWTLPFEIDVELVRSAFTELGTSRADLLELTRPVAPTPERLAIEACEYFRIAKLERTSVFEANAGVDVVLGLPAGTTDVDVRDFLRRTHATFEDVKTVASALSPAIKIDQLDDCSLDNTKIHATSAGALAQLGRILRIAFRTGLGVRDVLDATSVNVTTASFGEAITALWRVCRWRDAFEASVSDATSWLTAAAGWERSLRAALALSADAFADIVSFTSATDAPWKRTSAIIALSAALRAANLTANDARWLLDETRAASSERSDLTLAALIHALATERDAIRQELSNDSARQTIALDDAIEQLLARTFRLERGIVAKALRIAMTDSLGQRLRNAIAALDVAKDITPATAPVAYSSLRAIERLAFVVERFALDASEIDVTLPASGASAWWTIDPTTGAPTVDIDDLLAIAECTRLRRELPVRANRTAEPCHVLTGDPTAALKTIALACGWTGAPDSPDSATGAMSRLAITIQLASATGRGRIHGVARIVTTIQRVLEWKTFIASATQHDEIERLTGGLLKYLDADSAPSVETVRNALVRFLPPAQRIERLQVIVDRMRERCRDALYDFLDAKRAPDSPTLFDRYLIDPLVSACQLTSRVKSAISSLQLLIQRVLMDPASVPELGSDPIAPGTATTWKWMQSFRMWQANRKVFLYPENWIEPELRDNKTTLFTALEGALSQQDITAESVRAAYQGYLRDLHAVSRLEIVAIYTEEGNVMPSGERGCTTTHVVGRRWSQPRTHYYRSRHGGVWSAWEQLDADIDGEHVMLTVHNARPMIIWATIREGHRGAVTKSVPCWEIRLSWIERTHGRWGGKQTMDHEIALRPPKEAETPPEPSDKERFLLFVQHYELGVRVAVYYGRRSAFKTQGAIGHAVADIVLGTCGASTSITSLDDFPDAPKNDDDLQRLNHWPIGEVAKMNPGIRPFAMTETGDSRRSGELTGFEDLAVSAYPAPGKAMLFSSLPADEPYKLSVDYRSDRRRLFTDFSAQPFIYQSDADTYFIERSPRVRSSGLPQLSVKVSSNSKNLKLLELTILGGGGQAANSTPPESSTVAATTELPFFRVWGFEHQHACQLLERSQTDTVRKVFSTDVQATPVDPKRGEAFAAYYLNKTPHQITYPYPDDLIDFDPSSPNAAYNWELFFHVPFFIAVRLMQNERFEEALGYLQMIFDPTSPGPGTDRAWQFLPFRAKTAGSVVDMLTRLEHGTLSNAETSVVASQLAAYRDEPFNPHLIARLRPTAYMRAVVMRYLDCLIGWGDQLFGRLTLESLNQATLMYITAAKLLGHRPTTLPRKPKSPTPTLETIEVDTQGIDADLGAIGPGCDVDDAQPAWPLFDFDNFCPPPNTKMLAYWDTVEDRLFKLRNCQDLDGNAIQLPLFEPPIDPALLVRAAAAGVDIRQIFRDETVRLPAYRFSVILQKALELCNDVRALGAELQAVIEKRDAEALARLRQSHEITTLDAARAIRQGQIEDARLALAAVQRQRETAELRRQHYQEDLQRTNSREEQAQKHGERSNELTKVRGILETVAGILHMLPNLNIGGTAFLTHGAPFIAAGLEASARGVGIEINKQAHMASRALTEASYDRRAEEWDLQGRLAASELLQLDRQVIAAEVRLAIAERELENHERLRDNARSIDAQMRGRFSNLELFDWMVRQTSATYYNAFRQALEMARKAEACFRLERGEVETGGKRRSFIGSAQWDDLRQGLLAGHRLHRELRQMEVAYLDENTRDLEITKHISINQIDAEALMILRATGRCDITLSEALFDLDYPSHYQRRLKSVAVTIPAITGPHTNVNATLSLVSSEWRTTARAKGEPTKLTSSTIAAGTSIVTSSGQNDAGTFEQNLRDERYLPFEGAGAVSKWTLELPSTTNAFDMDSITDVILHVRYTARDESKAGARVTFSDLHGTTRPPMTRLFSLKHDFAREWAMATRPGASFEMSLDFRPFAPRWPSALRVQSIVLFVQGASETEYKGIEGNGPLSFNPVEGSNLWRTATIAPSTDGLRITATLPAERGTQLGWWIVATFR